MNNYNKALWTFCRENVVAEQKERKVVIWGIGDLSALLYSWAQERNISIYAFADRRKEEYKDGYNGIPVVDPDEVLEKKEEYYLWLCMDYYESMIEVLGTAGREEFKDYLYFVNIRQNSVVYRRHELKEDIFLDMFSDKTIMQGTDYREGGNVITGQYSNIVFSGTGNEINIGKHVIIGEDTLIACKDGSKIVIEDNCELHGIIIACDGSTIQIGENTKFRKDVRVECVENSDIVLGKGTRLRKKGKIFSSDHSSIYIEDYCKFRKKAVISATICGKICLKMGTQADEKTTLRAYKSGIIMIGIGNKLERRARVVSKVDSKVVIGDFCRIAEHSILASDVDSYLEMGKYSILGTDGVYMAKYSSTIHMGERVCTMYGMLCNVGYGSSLEVGERTRFNRDTTIIAGNSHPIFDVTKPERKYECNDHITLGSEIWSGRGASYYGGAEVGDGSVIGVYTMVRRKYPNNCMLMGNPARIIRRNIARGYGDSPDSKDSVNLSHYWKKTEGEEKKDEQD